MSFFLKGKPRQGSKRKFQDEKKGRKKVPNVNKLNGIEDEEIDSDTEIREVADKETSSDEDETAQEKKVRLAKLYLEEVRKREEEKGDDIDHESAVGKVLKDEALESRGLLHFKLADQVIPYNSSDVTILKCREQRLSFTCACLTSDGQILFTGSKCSTIIRWNVKDKRKTAISKYSQGDRNHPQCHRSSVSAIAVSGDGNWLVSSEVRSKDIHVWNGRTLVPYKVLTGHRAAVTGLVFRRDTLTLYSCSDDRSVKVWSLQEMAYVESMFGHQSGVTAIDAGAKEKPVTAGGRDSSVRIWKVSEETQLVLNAANGVSVDCIKLIDDEHFVTGTDNGTVAVWSSARKKPLCAVSLAHGSENDIPRWISSVAAARNSDLIASGSHDGFIKLWRVTNGYRNLESIQEIPVVGFVNGLIFSPNGDTLIALVSQEHRLGRWFKINGAKNNILIISLMKR